MDKDLIDSELNLADEFLYDAQLLLNEESIRSAESRLYYSVFHAARALLYSKGFSPKTHNGTISLFGKEILGNIVKNQTILTNKMQIPTSDKQ